MSTLLNKVLMFSTFLLLFIFNVNTLSAQDDIIDSYIAESFENNKGLQQQQFQLEKGLFALKEAHSLFLPTVSVLGSYVRSKGGRTIDFPIGDIMNPVYTTLNQLTESQNFPSIENASIQLNPDDFYDMKVRASLPLINTEIWLNRKIKSEQLTQEQAAVNVYKRQLVKDIKLAYFQYYQAFTAVKIYNNALSLVDENIRVTESMLRNGVRNGTALTRAQTEKQKMEATLINAKNDLRNAQAYFNFLLNQPLEQDIILDSALINRPTENFDFAQGINNREELIQLRSARQMFAYSEQLHKSHFVPKLNTFLDLGLQGFGWEVNNQTRYYMWGINLQWDLFASNQFKYKAKQAASDIQAIEAQTEQTQNQLELQIQQARNNYQSALVSFDNAKNQLELAKKYLKDQNRLFREGQLLYIELLDAQNQLTQAQLQVTISFANVQIAKAEIERSLASYPI